MLSPPAFSFPTKVLLLAEMNRKIKSMKEREIVMITIQGLYKLDIENPIIRINTAFKGCSSLEKISVLPRIYHN